MPDRRRAARLLLSAASACTAAAAGEHHDAGPAPAPLLEEERNSGGADDDVEDHRSLRAHHPTGTLLEPKFHCLAPLVDISRPGFSLARDRVLANATSWSRFPGSGRHQLPDISDTPRITARPWAAETLAETSRTQRLRRMAGQAHRWNNVVLESKERALAPPA